MSEIILYGAPWCSGCRQAKSFLEKNNVTFTYKNVDVDENMEEFRQYGFQSIPLLVSGDKTINGFKKEEYEYILQNT